MTNDEKYNKLVEAAGADVTDLREIIKDLWLELGPDAERRALRNLTDLAIRLEAW